MFLWKQIDNNPNIIPVTPSYLEHCLIIPLPSTSLATMGVVIIAQILI